MFADSLSNLTVKLQKTLTIVKGIMGYVGHSGSVFSRMIAHAEQEGEEPGFISYPGMRKAEGLGIGCETSWHVALNMQQTVVCG